MFWVVGYIKVRCCIGNGYLWGYIIGLKYWYFIFMNVNLIVKFRFINIFNFNCCRVIKMYWSVMYFWKVIINLNCLNSIGRFYWMYVYYYVSMKNFCFLVCDICKVYGNIFLFSNVMNFKFCCNKCFFKWERIIN